MLLLALPTILFLSSPEGDVATDEESAALLGKTKSASTNAKIADGSYGSIAVLDAQVDEYESQKLKKKEEERQKFEKKLQENGSWFRYDLLYLPVFGGLMRPLGIQYS